MRIKETLADSVAATPAGVTWDSPIIAAGKKATVLVFAGSVTNGSVLLKWGAQIVRAIVEGTVELANCFEVVGDGVKAFHITRINNSGTPRIIASWIDIAVED